MTASTGELEFEITLEGEGVAKAKITSPRTLKGLDLEKNGDTLTASYKGMTVPLPAASASKVFMLGEIIDSVAKVLVTEGYTLDETSEFTTISVPCGDSVCILTFDKEGTVTSAEINCGGKRTVYDVKIKIIDDASDDARSEGLISSGEQSS